MSKAAISLYKIQNQNKAEKFNTLTFHIEECGYKGITTAQIFYRFFDEALTKNCGALENMIGANKGLLYLHDFTTHSLKDCAHDYHYHLDLETMQLLINKRSSKSDNVEICYSDRVDTYINQHLNQKRCTYYKSKIVTFGIIFKRINVLLERLTAIKSLEITESYKVECDQAEDLCILLSSLSLSPSERNIVDPIVKTVSVYKQLAEAVKLKANTIIN